MFQIWTAFLKVHLVNLLISVPVAVSSLVIISFCSSHLFNTMLLVGISTLNGPRENVTGCKPSPTFYLPKHFCELNKKQNFHTAPYINYAYIFRLKLLDCCLFVRNCELMKVVKCKVYVWDCADISPKNLTTT